MNRRTWTRLLFVLIALSVGACSSSSRKQTTEAGVTIETFAFEPETVEVSAGTTVTWLNRDDIAHTVTSGRPQKQGVPGVTENRDAARDGLFDGALDDQGSTFSFSFQDPGAYRYFCSIHPGMVGRVIVAG